MPLKINPDTGLLDLVGSAGSGGDQTDLTGDSGGAVSPDGSDSITLIGDETQLIIATEGTPASNKMEIKLLEPAEDGELLIGHTANGYPSVNTLTAGNGISIGNSAGGITITSTSTSDLAQPTDSGTATSSGGSLSLLGGVGVETSGSGSTVTVTASASVPTSFVTDSGTGTPSGNSLTVSGGTGINTSGSGSSVTVNLDDPVLVVHGGSERQSATAYGVICGGTTTTSAQQSIAGLGTSGQFLQSNGAGALPTMEDGPTGDVTAGLNIDDNVIVRGDGGAKGIQGSGITIDDSDNVSGMGTLALDGDITDYQPTNDANPQVRLGATDAEEFHIQAMFDSGAQTLDYALYQTDAASATANKGLHRFNVDGTDIVDIDDGGVNLKSGFDYSINATSVLNATTLGSGVLNSDLTKVGTIATGVWEATDVGVLHGGTGRSTGGVAYGVIVAGTTATGTQQNTATAGTAGEVLISNGASAIPSWQSGSGLGSWVPLGTSTASTSSSIEFTSDIDSTYCSYAFRLCSVVFSTNAKLFITFSNDGGSSYESSNYFTWDTSDGTSGNINQIETFNQLSGASTKGQSGWVYLWDPSNSATYTQVSFELAVSQQATPTSIFGDGQRRAAEAVNAIKFAPGSGTFTSGTIELYGIKNV